MLVVPYRKLHVLAVYVRLALRETGAVMTELPETTIDSEIERRRRLPYHRVITGEPVEGYLGEVLELPGCVTAGATAEEALENLDEALAAWVEGALIRGMSIPDPVAGPASLPA